MTVKPITRFRYSRVDDRGVTIVQRIVGINYNGWFRALSAVPGSDGIPPYCRTEEAHDTAMTAARQQLKLAETEIRIAEDRLERARHVHASLSLAVGGKRPVVVVDHDHGAPKHGQ